MELEKYFMREYSTLFRYAERLCYGTNVSGISATDLVHDAFIILKQKK